MTPLYAIFATTHLGASLELEQSGTQLAVTAIADSNRSALAAFTFGNAVPASRPWL